MLPSSIVTLFNNTLAAVGALPMGAHIVPVLLLICGLIFWLAGGRFLKQLFALIGIASGAGLGAMFAADLLPATVGSVPGPYVAMGVGGTLGLVASILAFRFSMALCGALVLAAAGALGMGVYLSRNPEGLPLVPATEARDRLAPTAQELGDQLKKAADEYQRSKELGSSSSTPPSSTDAPELSPGATADAVQATREFAENVTTEAQELWSTTPERSRMLLLVGALGGAIIGAAAGMTMPKRAASLITAVLGAGLTLIAAGWLSRAFNLPGAHFLSDRGPVGMLAIWGGMAVFGILVQLRSGGTKPPVKKPDPKPDPAAH